MVHTIRKRFAHRPRLTGFSILAAMLLLAVYLLSPAQLPVVLHKLSLVILAAVIGYWLHRHAYPSEVHKLIEASQQDQRAVPLAQAAMLSRALLMGAAMIAVAVAL